MNIEVERGALQKQLDETVAGINQLTVLMYRLQGAIAVLDKMKAAQEKEHGPSGVSSGGESEPRGAGQPINSSSD